MNTLIRTPECCGLFDGKKMLFIWSRFETYEYCQGLAERYGEFSEKEMDAFPEEKPAKKPRAKKVEDANPSTEGV